MRVTRIYTGDDGRSHFEELVLPLAEGSSPSLLAGSLGVTEAVFMAAQGGTDVGRHNAPRRQLLINLEGRVEIECVDGKRVFGPGDIRFADDLDGEGHDTYVVDDVRVVILPVAADLDISDWRPVAGR